MTEPEPEPPSELPAYLAEGLPKQDDATLEQTVEYLQALLAWRAQPVTTEELPDDADVIETDDEGSGGTLVKEKVTCGKDGCGCADGEGHGPYIYRYVRKDGSLTSEYVGKPGEV